MRIGDCTWKKSSDVGSEIWLQDHVLVFSSVTIQHGATAIFMAKSQKRELDLIISSEPNFETIIPISKITQNSFLAM